MARVQLDTKLESGFVVGQEDLRALYDVLRQYAESPIIKMALSDAVTIETRNIDDVIKHPNTPDHRIVSVAFCSEFGADFSFDLRLDAGAIRLGGDWPPNVRIIADGPLDAVSRFRTDVNRWLDIVRPWYNRIVILKPFYHGLISGGIYGSLIVVFVTFVVAILSEEFRQEIWLPPVNALTLVLWNVLLFHPIIFKMVKRWMFVPAIFAVGDGKRVVDVQRSRRWFLGTVLTGALVALLAPIIGSYFLGA